MSILEDLDLMDLLDDLPDGSDFDLDDILFEFSTPGLFAAPDAVQEAPAPIVEAVESLPEPPVAEEPAEEAVPEAVEEVIPEVIVEEPVASEVEEPAEVSAPAAIAVEEEEVIPEFTMDYVTAADASAYEHNNNTLFGDVLDTDDILFEFGTPIDEEGVKLYVPAAQTADDVKAYTSEANSTTAEIVVPTGDTVVFDTLPGQAAESEQSVEAAPVQEKASGFFAKAAAAVMGLFASKKSEAVPAPVQQPADAEEDKYLALFTQEAPIAEVFPEEVSDEEVSDAVEAIEEAEIVEEIEPAAEMDGESELVPEQVEEYEACVEEEEIAYLENCGGIPVPAVLEEDDIPVIEEESEDTDDGILFTGPLNVDDILFDLDNTYAVEEPELSEEEDLKVYIPEEAASAPVEVTDGGTVVFESLDLSEESAPADAQPAVAEQPKAPGFFAKAAAAVMGLFASKKATKPVTPAAQPTEEEDVVLYVPEAVAEEDIPAIAFTEEDIAGFTEEERLTETDLLFLLADDTSDNTEIVSTEEVISAEDEAMVVPVSEAEELPLTEEAEVLTEAVPVEDNEVSEESPVIECESEEEISVEIPVIYEEESAQPEQAVEEPAADAFDSIELLGEDLGIDDILFELALSDDEVPDLPVTPVADTFKSSEEDEIKVYIPEEVPAAEPTEANDGSTIVFGALDLSVDSAPAEVQPIAVEQPKAPGFFAKAAGLVMSLFASKKATKTVSPAPQPISASNSEEDVFANLADLFSEGTTDDLTDLDELMLELQVEREAEMEAEAAAKEAAERLAREEEQRILELEAQRLAQEKADAEAEAARQKAEEDARIKAEADALLKQLQVEEEERQTLAEEELFDWIESAEKRRESAAAQLYAEEAPVSEVPVAEETSVILEAPVLAEESAEQSTPVYDFAAVELPSQEHGYTAPQMEININEDVPEEVGELLEMPDVDQSTAESEETPEEAAARKKKEEDNLHYKPEESGAKAVTSHIGKRFGAAFAAFTNASDDSDDEEDLGPELPANKAYRFFNKYISAYRFRLRISAVLCVILGWISLGLPVFGSLKNPAAAAAMCLMILLTVMLAGADVLATGVRNLIRKRATIHSLVALSCFASVIDAIVIIATKGISGYLPFCGVSAISMCFAIYGSLLYCRSQRLNFKTLDRANEPMTISVDYGIVEEDTSTVYRTPGHPEDYIHHSEEEDLSETVFGIMAPIMIPAIPVMTLIATLFSGGFINFFHIMAAMFAAAASFGALIAFPLPYFLVQRDLYATKAAIAGWAGAREIGRVSSMIVSDRDLFPDDTVSIKSVRIVDNVPPQLTLSYMCSIIHHSGSCLVPAFIQLAENNDCELLDVENFQCHEAGGLSGEIGPDSVLVASHSYMKLQGFRIPARKKDSENALFLAVNGHVIAYIIVDYKPIKSVRAGLQSALRGNVEMIFAARDFNVTPLLISKKFKSATETLRFPSYNQRYEITSQVNSETSACAAVVYRKSFYSYAVVVEKARYLYNAVSWGVILSAVSSVMGVLLMFLMALTGGVAAITVGRLLVFMLLWLIPTLALTVSITK